MEFKKTRTHSRPQARPRPDIAPRRPTPAVTPATQPASAAVPFQPASAQPQPASSHRHRFLFAKKSIVAAGVVAVIVVAGVVTLQLQPGKDHDASASAGQPEYQTVLPNGKPISELGGWKRISPPGKDPVFAYADTVSGVAVSVSEQPLPASFNGNTDDQMAALAEKFSATNKLEANGVTVYVGTSVKGPQSALLAKNDLLIMIKSQKKISDAAWKKYAASLR